MTAPNPTKGPFVKSGARVFSNGYQIIPIPLGGKGPKLADWVNAFPRTVDELRAMQATHPHDGIGIIATWTPAIDIDVLDERLALAMEQFIRDNLDDAPIRIGMAPKRLMMFRTESPFAKVTSASWVDPFDAVTEDGKPKIQRIEVLGQGQQYVAYHIHPKTGKPYTWPDDWQEPLEVPAVDLPVLTEAHARVVCREFDRLAAAHGWERKGDAHEGNSASDADALAVAAPPPESDEEVARVKAALEHISADCSRDDYLAVLAALKWTGWLAAEEIALEWAERSPEKFNEEHFARDWKSFKQDRGARTVTLGSLYKLAKDGGWDASRPAKVVDTSARFDELMTMLRSADLTDRAAVKALLVEIAGATLDAMDAAEIRKSFCKATKMSNRDFDRVVRETRRTLPGEGADTKEATHARYAKALRQALEERTGNDVVSCEGRIWTYVKSEHIWSGKAPTEFEVDVANQFDGQENCSRRNDYLAIANHLHSVTGVGNDGFFQEAPPGMPCGDRFYAVENGEIVRQPLQAHHRQRFVYPVTPKVMPTPLWDAFCAATFAGDHEREQELLLEEYVGACLIGAVSKYEKALFMYGKTRAGKGTILKIIGAMFPPQAVSAVPPTKWDREYYLADLAGKRVNLVGELSKEELIDENAFKTVTGRDELTARHPTHRPFRFRNEAGHVFQGNHFLPTKDHSEAFFGRWILMHFRNSVADSEVAIDTDLAAKIIETELPGVAARFLQGAKRLTARGKFLMTREHTLLMAQWRKRSSSIMEFLFDEEACSIGEFRGVELPRSRFYAAYLDYCKLSGRRPMGKHLFYEEMQAPAIRRIGQTEADPRGTGVRFVTKTGGVKLVRGVALVRQLFDHEMVPSAGAESEDW